MADLLVLGYHAVSERWPAGLASTPQQLSDHVRYLLDRGYRPTTFWRAATTPPATPSFAVTFDDAYRSVRELAFPILSELGVSGTVFVPTAFVGAAGPMAWPGIDRWVGGEHEHELACMTWDQLGELHDAGWEIGSHTHTHPRLPQLEDRDLAAELETSKGICAARLGVPCRSLAYPYGEYDDRVVEAAAKAGFEAAATLPGQLTRPEPLRFPRIGIYRSDDRWRFRLKVSRAARRLRSSRGWAAVAATRR